MFKILREVSAHLPRWRLTRSFFTAWRIAVIASAFFVSVYVGLFAIPKNVKFSYADAATCTGHLAILPSIISLSETSNYKLDYRGGFKLGGQSFLTTKICFRPTSVPAKGTSMLTTAPFGGPIFKQGYVLAVAEAPEVLATPPAAQTLAKPIIIKLSQPDAFFSYSLDVAGIEQPCTLAKTEIRCGIDKLGLKQGSVYELKLKRLYAGEYVGYATSMQVTILPAVKVTTTSITNGAIIYAKPQSIDITLDHALTEATAKLQLVDGPTLTDIPSSIKIDDSRMSLSWTDVLAREKSYKVTVTSVTATDGSLLDAPVEVTFQTSGGPKVVGINIGTGAVTPGSQAIVTFDQPLATNTNVKSLGHISGGPASISKRGNNQIVFTLGAIGSCVPFTLSIDAGLVGENGVVTTQPWSQASRISCRRTTTIGYSVKGRPILAYFYGSGASTVLYTGGIHGNEQSGMLIMQDWANYLDTNAFKIPAGRQIVVVPNLNPDGIATNQRYNSNNVNLDRNFDSSDWISDISLTNGQILPRGGGAAPMSEPETRAIAGLSASLKLRAEISFHSQGSVVGANKVSDSVAIGSLYANGVRYGTMFNNPETIMGYTLTGEYETWIGEKYGTPAILIELPTNTGRFFSRHLDTLWKMVNL